MKIVIVGAGYVGLVSGVCFADFGHDVICVEKDARKLEMLGRGEVPIYEPGLDALLAKNIEAGHINLPMTFLAPWKVLKLCLLL